MKSLRLDALDISLASPHQAAALWSSLATLLDLRIVDIGLELEAGQQRTFFFQNLSTLTLVR
jgi:hypothetical protein